MRNPLLALLAPCRCRASLALASPAYRTLLCPLRDFPWYNSSVSPDASHIALLHRWKAIVRSLRETCDAAELETTPAELIRNAIDAWTRHELVIAGAAVLSRQGVTEARAQSWHVDSPAVPACLEPSGTGERRVVRSCSDCPCEACPARSRSASAMSLALTFARGDRSTVRWLLVVPTAPEDALLLELLEDSCIVLTRRLQWLAHEQQHAATVRQLELERADLRATRDQLGAIIKSSPAAILSLDPSGRVLSWNPAAERMFGWRASEVVGQPMPFVPKHKRGESRRIIDTVMSGASLMGVQVTRLKRDGSPIELSVSTAPLRDAEGRTCGVMAATLDITEERRTAERLRESQRMLETLMGNLRGMVYRCASHRHGSMEFVSKGCLELTGYRASQLTAGAGDDKVAYASLIHPADAGRVWREVQDAVALGRSFVLEYRIRHASGTDKWVWEQGAGVFSPDGRLQALEGFIADVTPRKLAEDAARLGEARLASLFELSQKTGAGESELIDYALEEAVRLTGSEIGYFHLVEPDQLHLRSHGWSRSVRETCKLESQKHFSLESAGIWADCARYKCPVVHEDYQRIADRKGYPSGHSHIERHMSAPILFNGLVVAVAGVANKPSPYDDSDVRQLQLFLDGLWRLLQQKREQEHRAALESQLRLSRKMDAIGRLAAGIAHDFNNVVAAVTGYAEIVLDTLDESDQRYSDVVEIRKAGERAGALTRQLLAFARKQVLVPEVLSLNHVVAELEKMLRRLIGEDIELWVELDPNLAVAELDRGHVEQVIMNLVLNARDAMPQGGKLTLTTSNTEVGEDVALGAALKPGAYVCLAIADTGTGMDAATRERLFEPFFTTKPEGKGTGLGLATVYGIVTQSGGSIVVHSEPGRGSEFQVFFPVSQDVLVPPSARLRESPRTGSETILIVEDEDAVRGLAKRILVAAGYRVLEAPSGTQALSLCDRLQEPIGLLLCDVVLPGMPSRLLAEEVSRRMPGVRVLYMSAYGSEVVARHGVTDRGPHFLTKPFTGAELTDRVREVLDGVEGKDTAIS